MSRIERIAIPISTNTAAAGTAQSAIPVEGRVLEWVCSGSTGTALFGPGATATFTVTRNGDGGTILAATAVSAPFRYAPRRLLVTEWAARRSLSPARPPLVCWIQTGSRRRTT